jgi:hypothetical protein
MLASELFAAFLWNIKCYFSWAALKMEAESFAEASVTN